MPRFFIDYIPNGNNIIIKGEDASHIKRSLRMKTGDELSISDQQNTVYETVILSMAESEITLEVTSKREIDTELDFELVLYQAMPKGDKFEFIVQKATELGATKIVPVLTERCISRPKAGAMERKLERYRKIAEEAAKQSGRGRIPTIAPMMAFEDAVRDCATYKTAVIFYEGDASRLSETLPTEKGDIAIIIGSEGGLTQGEVDTAVSGGVTPVSLGRRILRCETAPITAISAILFNAGEY